MELNVGQGSGRLAGQAGRGTPGWSAARWTLGSFSRSAERMRPPATQTMAEQIPYYLLRQSVRPGLTGWAQTRFGYSVSLEQVTEKMRYDLYYIKQMSFWLDLRILVDTVKIVLFGRGAK